ncbi:hypothetical protein PWT90_08953 [Aphanocladium album]|nr:hypothetical protein PWT90_08953 [Aphanocladium album]
MSSFFYSTHENIVLTYPLPPNLDREFILQILRDESIMKRLAWLRGFEQGPEDEPKDSKWSDVVADIAFPFSRRPSQQMTKTFTRLEDGVEVVHETFALKMTTSYKVVDFDGRAGKPTGSSGLQLVVTGTVRLLKPLQRWVDKTSSDSQPPIHVARVRCFLEALSKSDRDVDAALASKALAAVENQYGQSAQANGKSPVKANAA